MKRTIAALALLMSTPAMAAKPAANNALDPVTASRQMDDCLALFAPKLFADDRVGKLDFDDLFSVFWTRAHKECAKEADALREVVSPNEYSGPGWVASSAYIEARMRAMTEQFIYEREHHAEPKDRPAPKSQFDDIEERWKKANEDAPKK